MKTFDIQDFKHGAWLLGTNNTGVGAARREKNELEKS